MAFGERPVEAVGKRVLAHVGEDFVVDLEGGEVCCDQILSARLKEVWMMVELT